MAEKGKLDHMEERLKAIEGGGDHAFADMSELYLVPDIVIPLKFKVPDFRKVQGDCLSQEPSKDVLSEDEGIRER